MRGRGRDERIIFRLTIVQRLIKGITFLMSRGLEDYVRCSRDCVPSLVSGFYLVRNCAPHLKFERILLSRERERERKAVLGHWLSKCSCIPLKQSSSVSSYSSLFQSGIQREITRDSTRNLPVRTIARLISYFLRWLFLSLSDWE